MSLFHFGGCLEGSSPPGSLYDLGSALFVLDSGGFTKGLALQMDVRLVHVHDCTCIVCLCVCVCVCACVCVCVSAALYVHMYVYMCMCICVCRCRCRCGDVEM